MPRARQHDVEFNDGEAWLSQLAQVLSAGLEKLNGERHQTKDSWDGRKMKGRLKAGRLALFPGAIQRFVFVSLSRYNGCSDNNGVAARFRE